MHTLHSERLLPRLATLLGALFFVLALHSPQAFAATCGDYTYIAKHNGDATITAYSGSEVDLAVPAKLDGNTVVAIAEEVFYDRDEIETVSLPKGVTSIGRYAFRECDSLASVSLPSSLKTIGVGAFFDCDALGSIAIPQGATKVGYEAFAFCDSLASALLPSTLKTIGQGAFANCDALRSIAIPKGVIEIGVGAFFDCDALESAAIPMNAFSCDCDSYYDHWLEYGECCHEWGDYSSYYCEYYEEYYDEYYDEWYFDAPFYDETEVLFESCDSLESVVFLEGAGDIVCHAFYDCDSLESVALPSTLKAIGSYAFYDCDSLESVALPSTLKVIGMSAFEGCGSLSSVSLPKSLKEIGYRAFRHCDSLMELTLHHNASSFGQYCFRFLPEGSRIVVTTQEQYKKLYDNENYLNYENTLVEYHPDTLAKSTTVSAIPLKTYTGYYIKPQPVVKRNGKKLVLGTDYTLSYKNNLRSGKASVIVVGKGKYVGSKTVNFKIRPAKVTGVEAYSYRGYRYIDTYWDEAKAEKANATGYKVVYKFGAKTIRTVFKNDPYNWSDRSTFAKKYVGKKITVRVYAYKTIDGVRYLSPVSSVKSVRLARDSWS